MQVPVSVGTPGKWEGRRGREWGSKAKPYLPNALAGAFPGLFQGFSGVCALPGQQEVLSLSV